MVETESNPAPASKRKTMAKKKKPVHCWYCGWKTYLAAFGFFILGIYLACTKQYVPASQMTLGALSAVGLRHAIQQNKY